MEVVTGDLLKEYIASTEVSSYKRRFCFEDLKCYILDKHEQRILCLYGLRRTGKTTLMEQAIYSLGQYANSLYVLFEDGDSFEDLKSAIKSNDCKYVFLDEVTKIRSFTSRCSWLYDFCTKSGKKIVITGTNSLGLYLASKNELYDRVITVHTTYIPYNEWSHLTGKDFFEYMKYGGTATDGSVFYNKDGFLKYTNPAIADNVAYSICNFENGRNDLASRYGVSELSTYIRALVELFNRKFYCKAINDDFVSHDLGSLMDILSQREIDIEIEDGLTNLEIRDALHINSLVSIANDKTLSTLTYYLEKMDVLYVNNDEYIFMQPGLRYSQLEDFVELLSYEMYDIPAEVREQMITIAREDIEGRILEDIVFVHFLKDPRYSEYVIEKYRNNDGQEIDVILINKKTRNAIFGEVKHSSQAVEEQTKHLNNEELCAEVEQNLKCKVVSKMVIYNGTTKNAHGCKYVNIEDVMTAKVDVLLPVGKLR